MPPKLRTFEGGIEPLGEGLLLPLLRAKQLEGYDGGNKPTADGTRARISDALACARQIGLRVLGVPDVVPMEGEVLAAFEIGNQWHYKLQGLILEKLGGATEVVASYKPEHDLSGSADGIYLSEDWGTVVAEVKTISGYGFKVAVGQRRSDEGPGPKDEHVTQAAMYGVALGANYLHIIYIDKDKHSIAEWIFGMDEQLVRYGGLSPRLMALQEIQRMDGILGRLDEGLVPARHIPGFGRVMNPPEPDSNDQPWQCRYCRKQPICKIFDDGPFPIEELGSLVPGQAGEAQGEDDAGSSTE